MHLLEEGGPVFMYTLLLLLFISIALFIYGLTKKNKRSKVKDLLSSVGLFAIIFGFFGQIIGLIAAFDAIESMGDVSQGVLAAGLKISFLCTGFGALVFLVARLGIIILTVLRKE